MATSARKILGTVLTIAIAAGIAWAESQSVSTPENGDFTITAVVVPGSAGAEVLGKAKEGMAEDDIIFSVGFDPDGELRVQGLEMGGFDPGAEHTVTADCYEMGGQWLADITVVDNVLGETLANETFVILTARPDTAEANANDVVGLVAE